MSRPQQGLKRPLSRTQTPLPNTNNNIIEISDDDEPPTPKRQKSTPPVANGGINGFLHRHAASSAGASEQHKPVTESPFTKESSRSRDIKSPWLPKEQTNKASFKKPLAKPDGGLRQNNTPFDVKGILTNKAKSTQYQQQTKSLASTRVNGNTSASRSSTPVIMGQKGSRKSQAPVKSYAPTADSEPEVIESDHDDFLKNIEDASDGESDIDDDIDILQHFKPTYASKSTSSTTMANATPKVRAVTPQQTIDVNTRPQSIQVPIRASPALTKSQRPTTPPRQLNLSVVVPQSESKADREAKKEKLMVELMKGTRIAEEKRDVVERYFGQNGFSEAFSVDDLARMMRAAPVFKRAPKDRSKVKLDMGPPWDPKDHPECWDKNGKFIRYNPVTPEEQVAEILNERFLPYQEHPRLTFRNDIDDRHIHGRFQFVDEYLIREDIAKKTAAKPNTGCGCQGVCNPTNCACLLKPVKNEVTGYETQGIVKTYKQHATNPELIVLDEAYMANELNPIAQHFEITECNEMCGCGPSCWNRVVGRGRDVPLEIYMTQRCGFGVRSDIDIQKGQFIDLYLGEVIDEDEVRARESIRHPDASSYIYSLDWFSGTSILHVDGEEFGSAMRFVNHSCNPNARNFTVQTHHGDKRIYNLAFFAIRDIPAGEQITIDYAPQESLADPAPPTASSKVTETLDLGDEDEDMYGAPEDKGKGKAAPESEEDIDMQQALPRPVAVVANIPNGDEDEEEDEGLIRCYCEAHNCRKYLWGKTKRRTRKTKIKRSGY